MKDQQPTHQRNHLLYKKKTAWTFRECAIESQQQRSIENKLAAFQIISDEMAHTLSFATENSQKKSPGLDF